MAAQHIVAVVGSYRDSGITQQAVDAALAAAEEQGATTECIRLAQHQIKFCDNCRRCTQSPGSQRGECHLEDDLGEIFDRMEKADALILASPVNHLDVTAITRAVLERMVAYFHWPWGEPAPLARVPNATRPAVLMTSSAMPRWMGYLGTRSLRTLGTMARAVGARPVGKLFVGLSADKTDQQLGSADLRRARSLGRRLVAGD